MENPNGWIDPLGLKVIAAKDAKYVNDAAIKQGNLPPWMPGTKVELVQVPAGTRYEMVINAGQKQAIEEGKAAFGAFATPETVTSQAFARDKLVILPRFKDDVSYVVTLETTAPQLVHRGMTGPLEGYAGGVQQVKFLGQRNLQAVGEARLLPLE